MKVKLQLYVLREIESDYALSDRKNASQATDCVLFIRETLQGSKVNHRK